MIRFGSVCSGIEAGYLAWRPLGWKCTWFSEIEPFPCAVLKYHFPEVVNYGDMCKLSDRILSGEIEAPELLCGGTPCQAFSLGGLRQSLDDERGNLSLVFCEIFNAIRSIRKQCGQSTPFFLWENVPGVLSTKDNAFGKFLQKMVGAEDSLIPADGKWNNSGLLIRREWNICWRILDSQYFGLPQRRKRVFVIGSPREGFDPCQILFEQTSVQRNPSKSIKEAKEVAVFVESSFASYHRSAIAGTIKKSGGETGGGGETLIADIKNNTLRRLTPLECERCQGFPDNYTKIPYRDKPKEKCPDQPRYEAIGNAWSVPVVYWIGNRIEKYLNGEL